MSGTQIADDEFKKADDIEALWNAIPHYQIGELPDNLPDQDWILYRKIVAKRAILAGYEDSISGECIVDLLADLRHVCDALCLDFALMDRQAYEHYVNEKATAAKEKNAEKRS